MKCKEAETLQTDCLLCFEAPASSLHYNLEVQAEPPQQMQIKTDSFFSIYGRNGIIPWNFLDSPLGLSR